MFVGFIYGNIGVTSGGGATVGVPLILLFGYPANMSIVAVKFGLLGSFITGTLGYRGVKNLLSNYLFISGRCLYRVHL